MRNFFLTAALVPALLTAWSLGARADEPTEPSVMDWLATTLLKHYPQADKKNVMVDVVREQFRLFCLTPKWSVISTCIGMAE